MISIVIPVYKPDEKILERLGKALRNQKCSKDFEIVYANINDGLAKTLNYGIARTTDESDDDIIVTVHQDCIPENKYWLETLIAPLKDKEVVATCSLVFDVYEKMVYNPLLDEKGCAYRKKTLIKIGMFDGETFLNSGEDMDSYLKLKKLGKIEYPNCIVKHYHKGYLKSKGDKKYQNANSYGTLVRVHGIKVPGYWKALILANPLNFKYAYWFWRGFFLKKQDWRKSENKNEK